MKCGLLVVLGPVEVVVLRAGSGASLALDGRGITGSDDWAVRDEG